MILQKYIRMRQDSFTAEQKIEAVRRCKFLLKSYAIGN
jgi:IQ calmodulin-binding motif